MRIDKEVARRAAEEEFGWNLSSGDSRWFLAMSGSMGFGNLGGLVSKILQKSDCGDRIICICGRNEETHAALTEEFKEDKRLEVLGCTDKVSMLMDACDVLFSKPGGITSTKAAIKNIPLVHTARYTPASRLLSQCQSTHLPTDNRACRLAASSANVIVR